MALAFARDMYCIPNVLLPLSWYHPHLIHSYSSAFGFSYLLVMFALLLGDMLLGTEDFPKGWECKSIFKSLQFNTQ